MDKNYYIDGVEELSSKELAEAISKGVVTFEELKDTGDFSRKKQDEVRDLLQQLPNEEKDWKMALAANSIDAFEDYVKNYPTGNHKQEADSRISALRLQQAQEQDEKEWQNAATVGTITSYKQYLDQFPYGVHTDDARGRIDELQKNGENEAWNRAVSINTIGAYNEYLSNYPDGSHVSEARESLATMQQEEDDWNRVDKSSKQALNDFIVKYPSGKYTAEAKRLYSNAIVEISIDEVVAQIKSAVSRADQISLAIKYLDVDSPKKESRKKFFLQAIRDNHNLLNGRGIKELIARDLFDEFELQSISHINQKYIKMALENPNSVSISAPGELTKISKLSTEVYFWGLPSSGKSCAIGSLLRAIQSGEWVNSTDDVNCQGIKYLNDLEGVFDNGQEVIVFPGGTPTNSTYEIAMDLSLPGKKDVYPVTIIDLAGEVYKSIHKEILSKGSVTDQGYKTMEDVLLNNSTGNRKIHFFVIEYGSENKLETIDYNGEISQYKTINYLKSAINYFDRKKVFDKHTNAIYILVTKADLSGKTGADLGKHVAEYVKTKFKPFYDGLSEICIKNQINGLHPDPNRYKVGIIPFTLGEVCFQQFCKVDTFPAKTLICEILRNSKGFDNSKLNGILNS